jgi:lambda family phage portal protein
VSAQPVLLDHRGEPLASMGAPHYGADLAAPEIATWIPPLYSADGELLQDLEILQARTQDLIRNHGLMSGGVQIHLDNIIGSGLRLAAKPDWRALNQDAEWAEEWARTTESKFWAYANDIDCNIDASQRLQLPGLLAQGYRSYLTSFEICATVEWLPKRLGRQYHTAIQMIDPARLSNPQGRGDENRLRRGVELGPMGEPVAYWISSALPTDPFPDAGMMTWKRVPRWTSWGRLQFLHIYDAERPGQSRGKHGIVSILAKSKMLEKFEQVTLQAAIQNAMYAAVIESSLDWTSVGNAIGASAKSDPVNQYVSQKAMFHKEGNIRYNGIKIPHLYPGEQLKFTTPQHPTAAFNSFEEAVLRHLAGGLNLSYEQLSRDYSKSNYSSARAAMLEAWRFFMGRRHFIGARFATLIYALWLEEAMDSGEIETPQGAPSFWEAKTAWTRCSWIGPGQGHIDPEKESNSTTVELQNWTTTLEEECAARGRDWEEVMEQRARELRRMSELTGVPVDQLISSKPKQARPDQEQQTDA